MVIISQAPYFVKYSNIFATKIPPVRVGLLRRDRLDIFDRFFDFSLGWLIFATGIFGKRFDASTDRNLATNNHIFLQALQVVDATRDCARDKNTSCILEGCGREEGIGIDRDLGDTA